MYNIKPSFDNMPEMMVQLLNGMKDLHSKIDRWAPSNTGNEEIHWFDVPELIKYLPTHPAEQTIYSWTSTHKIPFHKKGRRILFNQKEIDNWLQEGDFHKSESDLEQEALQFVNNKRNNIIK